MNFFLLSQKNYVGNNKLGKVCYFIYKGFEENVYKCGREYLDLIYRSFANIDLEIEFVVIGKIRS